VDVFAIRTTVTRINDVITKIVYESEKKIIKPTIFVIKLLIKVMICFRIFYIYINI
jgi:hypothetical protein